ncbi:MULTISPECIES: BolA family protein [Deefgea]|uniref:BolA/IbaG family iron-sulfur metabolism protein n=1 Tax=Deefgea chitinilytica TaxID=570276 RepID=A0ABS2CB94_9NEIS|nr:MULTISPECIES: BolA family protein [Deefgea]MBM5571347.1 BolA/IbaG family iron-sulfur metabolism protein [Deefgea chitinilytica]MBM9888580.1 BolA family transcriptional regulator [Deefgea sp. CFH1-16]
MSIADEIRLRLAALNPESIDIFDDSASHAGHAGAASGGGHFDVTIVSAIFAGKKSLERHRMVYQPLADLIPKQIHALSIRALTPDEF